MPVFQSREELLQLLKGFKPRLQQQWPVESLALFGSWLHEEATESSDVDLLITFQPGAVERQLDAWAFVRIQLQLQEWLGCPVDLVEKSALSPRLAARILPEAVEL